MTNKWILLYKLYLKDIIYKIIQVKISHVYLFDFIGIILIKYLDKGEILVLKF